MPDGWVPGEKLLKGRYSSVKQVIEAGLADQAVGEAAGATPHAISGAVRLAPPIGEPAHIFCTGLNYADHASETGSEAPELPRIFLRAASSLVGHGQPLIRPSVSEQFDFEGELAVIIGQGGRHIPTEMAMAHVAGYSCFMDGSVRDWQKNTTTMGKNFQSTGAFGPGIVPASLVENWQDLILLTRVNGIEMQKVDTALMIHTIADLIAYVSQMTALLPGDVIATGTPKGIGARRDPQVWLKAGDLVEVEISGIGRLANAVEDERSA